MNKGISATLIIIIVVAMVGVAVVSLQSLKLEVKNNEPTADEPKTETDEEKIPAIKETSQPKEKPEETPKEPISPIPKPAPTQPILKNIGFNLDFYDPSTKKAGDILFVNKIGDHFNNKIFLEFAHEVVGTDGPSILPHPTYFLPLGTKLFSPVEGKIDKVNYQERDDDYEINIIPDGLPSWRVSFDHIINLKVQEGDKVRAGDIVGEVAQRNSPAIPPELGWTELQVGPSSSSGPMAVCPFSLLDDSVKGDIESKITQLTKDWEEFIGKDVYKQEDWVAPGCLLHNITER